jgi:hypothetical protein
VLPETTAEAAVIPHAAPPAGLVVVAISAWALALLGVRPRTGGLAA